jgi:hypothetical protein
MYINFERNPMDSYFYFRFIYKGFKLLVLASIITGNFFNILFRIMQQRDIFIFNFTNFHHSPPLPPKGYTIVSLIIN